MIPLGTPGGVALRMHAAFVVQAAAAWRLGHGRALWAGLLALLAHEAAHVLAARAMGLRVEALELMPFGGVARMESACTLRPGQEAALALAGPAVSLLLALATAALARGIAARDFFRMNTVLCLVNLLPVLPLDGGRALRAALAGRLGRARATRALSLAGAALGAGLVALGVWAAANGVVNPMLFLCGVYLAYAALKEKESLAAACVAALHGRAERLRREGALPVRLYAVPPGVPAQCLAARLHAGAYCLFVEVDDSLRAGAPRDEGAVLTEALGEALREARAGSPR